jgi:hypothetical protein
MWKFPKRGSQLPVGRFLEYDPDCDLWVIHADDGRSGWYESTGRRPGHLVAETRETAPPDRDDRSAWERARFHARA